MILFLTFSILMCLHGRKASEINFSNIVDDPDMYRNVSELITSKGYPVEEHCVETADGYLLSVQRIPHGRNGNKDVGEKKVVLLIHGVLGDATIWLLNFPGQSLGFVLSDEGYDVWLLNTRGGTYSKKHAKYTPNQQKFWDFSFDELAKYDIPNTIDYILKATQREGLYIIGHSQGTTATLAMLSEMSDYNDKVKLLIALAPVAFLSHTTSIARDLIPYANTIAFFLNIIYSGELLSNDMTETMQKLLCDGDVSECYENLYSSFIRSDAGQVNKTRFNVYLRHYPTSTSAKSLLHFAQLVKSEKFRKYDYGRWRNLKCYEQEEPSEYDLSKIATPVALFWSTNDDIADPEDVKLLRKNLNSLVMDYCVPYPYSHSDFVIALNAPLMINGPILKLLRKY